MEEQLNLADYAYTQGTTTAIEGEVILALIQVLENLEKQETRNSFITFTPKALKKGEIEWNKYTTPQEFFSQTPQQTVSILGVQAMDLRYLLLNLHHQNVKDGVAVLKEEIGKFKVNKSEELKLS